MYSEVPHFPLEDSEVLEAGLDPGETPPTGFDAKAEAAAAAEAIASALAAFALLKILTISLRFEAAGEVCQDRAAFNLSRVKRSNPEDTVWGGKRGKLGTMGSGFLTLRSMAEAPGSADPNVVSGSLR